MEKEYTTEREGIFGGNPAGRHGTRTRGPRKHVRGCRIFQQLPNSCNTPRASYHTPQLLRPREPHSTPPPRVTRVQDTRGAAAAKSKGAFALLTATLCRDPKPSPCKYQFSGHFSRYSSGCCSRYVWRDWRLGARSKGGGGA